MPLTVFGISVFSDTSNMQSLCIFKLFYALNFAASKMLSFDFFCAINFVTSITSSVDYLFLALITKARKEY